MLTLEANITGCVADDFPPVEQRLANILARLSGVHKRPNGQYEALCNCHDDTRPSLGVKIGDNGGIVITCLKGCPRPMIMAALGYNMAYLRPDGMEWRSGVGQAAASSGNGPGKIVATYDYRDEAGELVSQVVRFEPKDFRQRQPDGNGGWKWSIAGAKIVPYRLPEIKAAPSGVPIFVVEGEKDADRLHSLGLVATCNAMGAAKSDGACKWKAEHSEYLRGRSVVIIPDNDNAGRDHANGVARSLAGVAADVKLLQLDGLAEKGDVSDWLDAGNTADRLLQLAAGAPAAGKKIEPVKMVTAGELDATEFKREFIVSGILTAGEPMLIAGPPKSLKTSIMLDMALAIGSGTKFLNHFPTSRRRVGILSAESGEVTIQETMRRIASAKGIHMADADVLVGFDTPCLGSDEGLATFGTTIKERGVQVMVVDPVYLSLLGQETKGINAANLFDIGPLLRQIVKTCKDVDCTLILLHHVSKGSQRNRGKHEDLELSDMSMAGFAEFARQWLLIGRRENYGHNGYHQMKMLCGGSAGHGGGYAVDVTEGVLDDCGGGRWWEVSVRSLDDDFEQRKQLDEKQAESKKQSKFEKLLATIVGIVERYPAGQSTATITSDLALAGPKLSGSKVKSALMELERRRVVMQCDIRIPIERVTKDGNKVFKSGIGWKPFGSHQQSLDMGN